MIDFTVQMDDPGVALFVAMGNVVCEKIASRKNCVGNHTWLVHQTSPTWLTGANPLLWIWVTFIHYTARIIINNCPVTWGKIKSINYLDKTKLI